MGDNLLELKEIETKEIPDIFVAQWFHNYYNRDSLDEVLMSDVLSVIAGFDGYEDMFRSNNETSFEHFLHLSELAKQYELERRDLTYWFGLPDVRQAYFQYLLRFNFERQMADNVPTPLYQLFYHNLDKLFPCLFVYGPMERLFDPIYQVICSDNLSENRRNRINKVGFQKFLETNIKGCTSIHLLPTILSLLECDFFDSSSLKNLQPVEVSDNNTLKNLRNLFSCKDRNLNPWQNNASVYCIPADLRPLIDWLKDILERTSLDADDISLLLKDEFGFDYCSYGIVESYDDGTRAPFPKLCALAAAECEGETEYTELCEEHWDDPLLCALLASVTNYEEYPEEIQKEFFRMCHYAGLKTDTSLYDFSQDCNYTTKKYEDDPFIKLDAESCLKSIIVDTKPQLQYRVFTRTETSDGWMPICMMEEGIYKADAIIEPDFDETYDSLQEALNQAIELEQERRGKIVSLFKGRQGSQLDVLNSELRVHIEIGPVDEEEEDE